MQKSSIRQWEPQDFQLETTSIWSFPEHGSWATHNGKWRGNWSPYVPRNIILRYSQPGDLVLDQFAGGGTTLVEAKLLNRNIIGIDISETALAECAAKTSFAHDGSNGRVFLKKGDARYLSLILDESIDLICTHPPYANIIRYSEDIPEDMSRLELSEFLTEMQKVVKECYRVLQSEKYCAILMGDIRQGGVVIPLGFKVMSLFENGGFKLKELIIKEQHNCRSTGYWKASSSSQHFMLLAHEYLFIFRKESKVESWLGGHRNAL